jgi:hypothetical protein
VTIHERVSLLGGVAAELTPDAPFYGVFVSAPAGRVRYLIRNRVTAEYEYGIGTLSITGGVGKVTRDTVIGNHFGTGNGVYFNYGSKEIVVTPETWPGTAPHQVQLSPAAWSANQNDYNPAGLANANWVRIDLNGATRNLTGLAGGYQGRVVLVENLSSPTYGLTLVHESGSSVAANRFWMSEGADYTLNALSKSGQSGAMTTLIYCGTRLRWRVLPQSV